MLMMAQVLNALGSIQIRTDGLMAWSREVRVKLLKQSDVVRRAFHRFLPFFLIAVTTPRRIKRENWCSLVMFPYRLLKVMLKRF